MASADHNEIRTLTANRHAIGHVPGLGARRPVLVRVDAARADSSPESATAPFVEAGEESVDSLVDLAEAGGIDADGTVDVGHPPTCPGDGRHRGRGR